MYRKFEITKARYIVISMNIHEHLIKVLWSTSEIHEQSVWCSVSRLAKCNCTLLTYFMYAHVNIADICTLIMSFLNHYFLHFSFNFWLVNLYGDTAADYIYLTRVLISMRWWYSVVEFAAQCMWFLWQWEWMLLLHYWFNGLTAIFFSVVEKELVYFWQPHFREDTNN